MEAEVAVSRNAPATTRIAYSLGELQFELAARGSDPSKFDLRARRIGTNGSEFHFIRNPGRPWQPPRPIKSYAFPDQARTYYQNASFLADLEAAYEAELDHLFYLGPLREFPQRDYSCGRTLAPPMSAKEGIRRSRPSWLPPRQTKDVT